MSQPGGMYANTAPGNPPMSREQYEVLRRKTAPLCSICGRTESRYPYILAIFQLDDQSLPVCGGCKPDLKELVWKLIQRKRATVGLEPMSTAKPGRSS